MERFSEVRIDTRQEFRRRSGPGQKGALLSWGPSGKEETSDPEGGSSQRRRAKAAVNEDHSLFMVTAFSILLRVKLSARSESSS